MGFFDRIFRRFGSSSFTKEPMTEDGFWKIIQESFDRSSGDFPTQQATLASILRKLTPRDIILFNNRFIELSDRANDWKLWGAIYLIHGGCSDDSFMDFRGWLIAQGKDFYYATTTDPESLIHVGRKRIDVDWEGMAYIAPEVFSDVAEDEMPPGYSGSGEVKGTPWSEEGDDLKKMLPQLWEIYGSR